MCDELAKWPGGDAAWDNLVMGLRLGEAPRALITTTPRPTSLMRRIMALPGLEETRGGTNDNAYPVVEAEDMPDVVANSLSIAFGNFRAGYLVADRGETRILRGPFSNKPFVHFYATKRVGGAIIDSQAIKLMKFAAS